MVAAVRLAVIIPARDVATVLSKQLKLILCQEASWDFEVIVVDNGSIDDTSQIATKLATQDSRVRVVQARDGIGVGYARNVGVANSSAQFLVFVDADDLVHPGWLQAFIEAFESGALAAVGRLRYVTTSGIPLFETTGLFPTGWASPGAAGSNSGFTRKVYDSVGGFDENLRRGWEDIDFFVRSGRKGYRIVEVRDALIDYVQREDPGAILGQWTRYGEGLVDFWRSHASWGMPAPSLFKAKSAILFERLVGILHLRKNPTSIFRGLRRLGRNVGLVREFSVQQAADAGQQPPKSHNRASHAINVYWWAPSRMPSDLARETITTGAAWTRLLKSGSGMLTNFGDEFSQIAVAYATGRRVNWARPDRADLVGLGSVLNRAMKFESQAQYWGTGLRGEFDERSAPDLDQILAARGPQTQKLLGFYGPIGDPGLLVRGLVGRPTRKRGGKVYIPHFRDWNSKLGRYHISLLRNHGIKILASNLDPLEIAREISHSDFVVSSSLHGLIFADALGVANQLVMPASMEPTFKYLDYFGSVGSSFEPISHLELVARINDSSYVGLREFQTNQLSATIDGLCEGLMSAARHVG